MNVVEHESYQSLKEKMKAMEQAVEAARKNEIEAALNAVRRTIKEYGLTERDIFGARRLDGGRDGRIGRVRPKYRNPATGETWSGRGRPPRWIAGQEYAPFLIRTTN